MISRVIPMGILSPVSPDFTLKVSRQRRGNAFPLPLATDFPNQTQRSRFAGCRGTGGAVAPPAQRPFLGSGGEGKERRRARQRTIESIMNQSINLPIRRKRKEEEQDHIYIRHWWEIVRIEVFWPWRMILFE